VKGLWHAHTGWLFDRDGAADRARYAKDLLDDRGLRIIGWLFMPTVVASLLVPAAVGWLWIGGRYGFLAGLVWGGAVRILLLHHVTWSINSICHVYGERPFATKGADRAANFWPLAIVSMGESWHNSHHADPTCARHGVMRGQLDPSARVIWAFERAGWVSQVRWPAAGRFESRRLDTDSARSAQTGPWHLN